jgi:uncharacterized protein (UPF0264 family)
MLASVTTLAEARLALQADVDIIDLKDPAQGALGALSVAIVRDVVVWIAGRKPVSATIGDFSAESEGQLRQAIEVTAACGVDYVKVGFFPGMDECIFLHGLSAAASSGAALVVVLFADLGWPQNLLQQSAACGVLGVMLDTARKNGRGLREHLCAADIGAFVREAKTCGLITGLAGSLASEDVPHLLPLVPDYLGFRGALCNGRERTLQLDVGALAEVHAAMNQRATRPIVAAR